MANFNAPFITTRSFPTGGGIEKTGQVKTSSAPAPAASRSSATAPAPAAAFSPELGQRFKNGPTSYRTVYNDPVGKRAIIRDDRGNELLIHHSKLQRLLEGGPGTTDLGGIRRFNPSDAAYFKQNTQGGQPYYGESGQAAAVQAQANDRWNTYSRAQRPIGAYYASGRPALTFKEGASQGTPITRGYRKGGLMVKPTFNASEAARPGDAVDKKKSVNTHKRGTTKLVAKKEKCGGKMKEVKMSGGKMSRQTGDCGCS